MKKLVFMFAAVVAVSFASCGGNTKPAEPADTLAADTEYVEVTPKSMRLRKIILDHLERKRASR